GFCLVRHGLALIVHLCNFLILSQQMNLSIAMPATVNNTTLLGPLNASMERFSVIQAPTCDWSPQVQGIILSSINYVSILAQIPTGYIAGIFEAKYLVGVGLLLSSILTFFIPLAADAGVALLMVLQIVQGIAQVMVLTSQINSSALLYQVIETKLLAHMANWILFLGGIGCACFVLWFPLVYNDPIDHLSISTGEKEYIMYSLDQQVHLMNLSAISLAMIKSLPLWGILVFYFSEYWIFYFFIAYMPTYISSVCTLLISGPQSRILSALLISIAFISTILGGLLADFLLSRKILRLMTIRKFSTAIGVVVPSVVLVSLHWVRSNLSTSMVSLALSSTTTFCYAGALINFLDIVPRYTGFLRGMSQDFGHLSGAISSAVAGFLINQDSESGWRNVFLTSASIYVLGLVFYIIFGRAEVQDWATGHLI
uniref:Solute carrier family 17 member 4 n=1 Tax=Canis lupus familiaris TaxID=9615 RepID=A0A8C0TNN7_CANLF